MLDFLKDLKREVDMTTVVSVVVGLAVFGGITYVAVKSGVKPLKAAAQAIK